MRLEGKGLLETTSTLQCKHGASDKSENDPFVEYKQLTDALIEATLLPEEVARMSLERYCTDAKEREINARRRLQVKTRLL